jgi:hypothetical protein
MIYEYLHPKADKLKDKPMRAEDIMNLLNEEGFSPLTVRVDNHTGQVFIYFEKGLSDKEKEKLDEVLNGFLGRW